MERIASVQCFGVAGRSTGGCFGGGVGSGECCGRRIARTTHERSVPPGTPCVPGSCVAVPPNHDSSCAQSKPGGRGKREVQDAYVGPSEERTSEERVYV